MFLTCDQHRLPFQSGLAGKNGTVWAVTEMWTGGDALVVQFSKSGDRGLPRTVMMDLVSSANSLEQFVSDGVVLRDAAVLRVTPRGKSERFSFETVREIRIGATETDGPDGRLLQVTQFTTSAGRQFSVPFALAEKASRGRRIYRERSVRRGKQDFADAGTTA
ncbi:hypothetical protein [Paraburkholderia fungorum]|uniref:hypothetical protein n=1 Tax=Paraburkholderia fungorum TaxID=134537 RepID=UPI00094342C5|nr:hypothetical protein [Paraburkholderia fungorum]